MTEFSNPVPAFRGRWKTGLASVALLAAGGAVGGVAGHAFGPTVEMAPVQPVAINALAAQTGIVTIRSRVQEVYGNKFLATDATGRTLVDLGRAGSGTALVAPGQTVTVQGRFVQGVFRASFLIDTSNSVRALGPGGMRSHDRDGRHGPGRDGPGRDGPRGERSDGPVPSPAGDATADSPAVLPVAPGK